MSKPTTSFQEWLADNDPQGHEDIYALYQAVSGRCDYGRYRVTKNGNRTFVHGSSGDLLLASADARHAFLRRMKALQDDPELDTESWHQYRRNMANASE